MPTELSNPPSAVGRETGLALARAVDWAPPNSVVETRTVIDGQGGRSSVITIQMEEARATPVPTDDDREWWYERRP